MCRSHEKAAKALVASCNEVLILKKKIWKFDPLPQQAPAKTLFNALPKVHFVGMEERLRATEAWSMSVVRNAVTQVFDSLYCAIERSSSATVTDGHTTLVEQFTAKYLVDECYQALHGRAREAKSGFLPIKFSFEQK